MHDDFDFVETIFNKKGNRKEEWEGIDWEKVRERFWNWKFSTAHSLTLTVEQHSRLLDLEDLAGILGVSLATLRSWPSKYPHRLPPRTYVTGADLVRFNPADVESWINNQRHLEARDIEEKRSGRKRTP